MRKSTTAALAGLAFAGGAVFATTTLAGAAHQGPLLVADLDGRSEVSDSARGNRIVGDPNGSGEAYLFTSDGKLCYVLEVDKIDPATAAHIHEAPAGENGGVVVTLGAPVAGYSAACTAIDGDLLAEITANPADYYVNIHNAEYPGGALRGQLADGT